MTGVITNDGLNIIADRVKPTASLTGLAYFSVGIGSTTPGALNSSLETPVPISGAEIIDNCDATTGWAANGVNSVALTTTYYKEGTGAITLIKSDATTATASITKTVSNLADFTDKKLWQFVYISATLLAKLVATGAALTIKYGQNSANYYQRDYTASDLSSGWNYLVFSSTNATGETGTPTTTNLDYYVIEFITINATDTASADDFVLDDIKVASTDDEIKTLATGYPITDTINHQTITRTILSATEANGYNISEVGIKNNDSTKLLYSHDVFTAITKNKAIEIQFELVDSFAQTA